MTFLQIETIIIELLLIVSLVAIAVRRFYIPYTVALVLVGLLIAIRSPFEIQAELTPELILALFVPPSGLRSCLSHQPYHPPADLTGILLLAVPGVIITTLIVGGLVSMGTFLSLPVALVFGSLIAATDPVAVVALFKSMGVPKRLSVLLEGESLLNDGTAIVTFGLVLTMALTGSFSLVEGVADFILVAVGGTLVGLFLGLDHLRADFPCGRLSDRDHPDNHSRVRFLSDCRTLARQRRACGGCRRIGQREYQPAWHEPHHPHCIVQFLGVCGISGKLPGIPVNWPGSKSPSLSFGLAASLLGYSVCVNRPFHRGIRHELVD